MKEIALNLDLNDQQVRVLDHHSLLNILNVIVYELLVLSERMSSPPEIESILDEVHATAQRVGEGTLPNEAILEIGTLKDVVLKRIEDCTQTNLLRESAFFEETHANLESIFNCLDLRIFELRERYKDPLGWENFTCDRLAANLRMMFAALALNSKGRYGFTDDPTNQGPNDYLLRLRMRALVGDSICMPPVIQDLVRDLAANARKYTAPGGEITVQITEDPNGLEFEVKDTGIGIPEEDIPGVLRFGYRGRNVAGMRTMGGGFGLTKAYHIVQLFGGKMWIESVTGEGSGTLVRCQIPRPAEACKAVS